MVLIRMGSSDRFVIVQRSWRSGLLALVAFLLVLCGGIWAGWSGNTGIIEWAGDAGRVFVVVLSALGMLAVAVVVLSNVVQGWALLVGDSEGLQVLFPLGLHRLFARSRLVGSLEAAEMRVRHRPAGRFMPALAYVTITAPEGALRFSFGDKYVNRDYRERFEAWVASRGSSSA